MTTATILGIHSAREVFQAVVSGIVSGSGYGLLGAAFALILAVTGRFHFALGIVYAITAYLAAIAVDDWGFPLGLGLVIGLLVGVTLGVLIEAGVYRPLAARAGENALLGIFVASLGLVIAGENLIRLIWGNDTRNLAGFPDHTYTAAGLTFTLLEITLVLTTMVLVAAVAVLLNRTILGQQIRAVRGNPQMAQAIGVDVGRIFLLVFALGTGIAGVAALFDGMRFAVTPDMGNTPIFYAVVVAFVAGNKRSPIVVGAVGLGIGLVQSLSTIWVSDNLSSLTVFGLLFVVLSVRSVPNAIRQLSGAMSGKAVRPKARPSEAA